MGKKSASAIKRQTELESLTTPMGEPQEVETMPAVSLQSKAHEDLLNIIDELRLQGISRYIDLPQIIVCGDQSSGKSSVLEGISGLQFPTKDNLCTRFATELVLRRGAEESATFTILPDTSRPEDEQNALKAFECPTTSLQDDLASIIESAEKAMGLNNTSRNFSKDILRVELSGPQQPHLTLVDLPGLFHAGNKAQSVNDAESVKALVQSYMQKSRSIILAVVSAKNDYANQIITKYARDLDPQGYRTLGIITKPDTLHAGSDSERAFIELAENKDVQFRLGWHTLRNRDYDTKHFTAEERDENEEQFFGKGIWTSLPRKNVGIKSLKTRLSQVLKDQILLELPSLIQDVNNGIKECERRLASLGASRGSLRDQQKYLSRVAVRFSTLVEDAVRGDYKDSFFSDPFSKQGLSKRLRTTKENLTLEFVDIMSKKGHATAIVKEKVVRPEGHKPVELTRDEFIDHVQLLIRRTRGMELPGTFNPAIIRELFRDQSAPWQEIAQNYTNQMFEAAQITLDQALEHAADQAIKQGVLQNIINPRMEAIRQDLDNKIAEFLTFLQNRHPSTYNHYFTDVVQAKRHDEWKKDMSTKLQGFFNVDPKSQGNTYYGHVDVSGLLETLTKHTQADMDRYACSEVINYMEAYYKTARKQFVDNVGTLGIEECLLYKLPGVFSSDVTDDLSDEAIESIAAETDESMIERASSTQKLEILLRTRALLQRLSRQKPRGMDPLNICGLTDSRQISKQPSWRKSGIPGLPTTSMSPENDEGTFTSSDVLKVPTVRTSGKEVCGVVNHGHYISSVKVYAL